MLVEFVPCSIYLFLQEVLLRVWEDVCIFKDADIVVEQWFLLCKLLAYSKKNSNFSVKPTLSDLINVTDIEYLDFFLDKIVERYDYPLINQESMSEKCPTDIDVDNDNWENVIGSSMELGSTYTLYTVQYATCLAHFSRPEGNTQRRFSDFEFLVEVLGYRYQGMLIPPLPPKYSHLLDKDYISSQNKADHIARLRAQDLSIFLKHLAMHPVLSQSIEFMIFAQTSTTGYASFKKAISKVKDMRQQV